MTEAQWLACENPTLMLESVLDQASERKLRLFAVACCRRVWDLLTDPSSRTAVEVSEQFADGLTSSEELAQAFSAAFRLAAARPGRGLPSGRRTVHPISIAASSSANSDVRAAAWTTLHDVNCQLSKSHPKRKERSVQTGLLRCVFGNPFRPVALDPAWLTSTVVQLARGIYDEKAFDRMPILADALEDAGCDSDDVLTHCRDPKGVHVRGCWVVDLVLGKS